MTVRSLGLTSSSRKTICCQVPRVSFLSRNGTDKSGPIVEARIWECPLPSCHPFSCSYDASLGASHSSAMGKSARSPGAYSIVVIAPVVLKILGIDGREGHIVSVAMNVISKKQNKKDIVKVENRELKPGEVDKIALIAPSATISIIRDYEVAEKTRVKLPDSIRGIVRCSNPACVSNAEPVEPRFSVERQDPLRLRCYYCVRIMEKTDVLKQF